MPEVASKIRSFQADGQVYDIPVNDVTDFLNDMPKATEVRSFKVDKDTLDIPITKLQEFLTDMPDARPLHDYEDLTPVNKPEIDYGPFDKSMVQRSPRARQNFERWQEDQGVVNEETEDRSFVSKLGGVVGNSLMTGLNNLNSWIADVPALIYDIAGAPFRAVGMKVPTSQDFEGGALENISDYYKSNAKAYEEKVKEINPDREKGIIGAFQNEGIEAGVLNLAGGISESLPASLAMMLSGGSTLPTLLGSAAVFGAGKVQELDENAPEMDYDKRRLIGVVNGTLEGVFETYLGSGAVGKSISDIIKREGIKAADEGFRKGIARSFSDMITKNPWIAPLGEGFEEVGTQISQNFVDKYSGYRPDINITEGIGDAFISGVGMGGIHGAAIGLAKYAMKEKGIDIPGVDSNEPINTDGTQLTVDPRQAQEAKIRQFAEGLTNKSTGTIQTVELILPEGYNNTHWFVAAGQETDIDGSMLIVDDLGNQKFVTKNQIVGDVQEISVDDFVNGQLSTFDQQQQQADLAANNQMNLDGRIIARNPNGFYEDEAGQIWNDVETGEDVLVPHDKVKAWEQIKNTDPNSKPNIVSRVYGKTEVSGVMDEQGNIMVPEPYDLNKAEQLKADVEKQTGGQATVVATPIENQDATNPLVNISIVPVANIQAQQEQLEQQQQAPETEQATPPVEKKVITQTFGNKQIDIVENEGYDEIVATDKMPLEAALPILEKKFKDNKRFKLEVDKVQVEIPGETKYDDPIVQTVVKSIKIVPKNLNNAKQGTKDTGTSATGNDQNNANLSQGKGTTVSTNGNNLSKSTNVSTSESELTPFQKLQAEIKQLEKDMPFVRPEYATRHKQKLDQKQQELATFITDRVNSLMDEVKAFNAIPGNHTTKRQQAAQDLMKRANQIGYKVGNDTQGNITLFDANNIPVVRKTAVKTPQEEIEQHPSLQEYENKEFVNFGQLVTSDATHLIGVKLGNLSPKEIESGIKNILAGKKTVAANNVLDELENIFNKGEISFKLNSGATESSITLNDFIQHISTPIELSETELQAATLIPEDIADAIINNDENLDYNQLFSDYLYGTEETTTNRQADSGNENTEETQTVDGNPEQETEAIEAKKADIERRRQGDLSKFEKRYNDEISEINSNEKEYPKTIPINAKGKPMFGGTSIYENAIKTAKDNFEYAKNQINDKYDAELAELENISKNNPEKLTETQNQQSENQEYNDNKLPESSQINQLDNEKPIEQPEQSVSGRGQNTEQAENQPEEEQGQGNKEGLEQDEVNGADVLPLNNTIKTGKKTVKVKNEIKQAESETEKNPTDEQKKSGEYQKGHVNVNGFDISIESPKGIVRSGKDENGKEWSVELKNTYGYYDNTNGTEGNGEEVDVFLGPKPLSDKFFVVDQVNKDGSFDEHKVMQGFDSIDQAKAAYLSNYEEGWNGLGAISELSKDEFSKWLKQNNPGTKAKRKSVSDNLSVKKQVSESFGYFWRGDVVNNNQVMGVSNPAVLIAMDVISDIKTLIEDFSDLKGLSEVDGKDWTNWNEVAKDLIEKNLSLNPEHARTYNEKEGRHVSNEISADAYAIAEAVAKMVDFDKAVKLSEANKWENDRLVVEQSLKTTKPLSLPEMVSVKKVNSGQNPNQEKIDKAQKELDTLKTKLKSKEKEINKRNGLFGDDRTGGTGDLFGGQFLDMANAKKVVEGLKSEISRKEKEIQDLTKAGETAAKENAGQKEIINNDNGNQEPRSTETLESEIKTIESEAENVTDREQAGKILERIDELLSDVEANLTLKQDEYSTEGINHEYPNIEVAKQIKRDVSKFSKALAKGLGWEHDTDRRNKPEYAHANIAPAGGDATFILWKPDSKYGVYVSIPYNPETINNWGGYENYQLKGWNGTPQILWRITTKDKKYSGLGNRYVNADVTVSEFRDLIQKAIKSYDTEEQSEISKIKDIADNSKGQIIIAKPDASWKEIATPVNPDFIPHDGWKDNLIKARVYAVGLFGEKEIERWRNNDLVDWTDRDAIIKAIESKLPVKAASAKELSPAEKRLAELNERMKKLLPPAPDNNVVQEPADSYGKQRPNPEIMAIGTEMATLHIELGKVKFADFAKQMVADLGDSVKPYLKSFYNGARDLPGMEEYESQMDEYSDVKKADIDEILKEKVNLPQEQNEKPVVPEEKKVNKPLLPLEKVIDEGKNVVKNKTKRVQSNENNVNLDNKKPQPDGKQGLLQRNNKRLPRTESPTLFDGIGELGGTGRSIGTQGNKVSGTNEKQQQPTGREGNLLPRNADVLNPALVEFNADENDTRSFNPSQKYNDNIKAIETVISLISEKRKATSQEKEILSRYVGFGGLKDVLLNPDSTEGWKESNTKFKPLVKRVIELSEQFDNVTGNKGSLSSIRGSILNAHFTSSSVIKSVYDGLNQLGFTGGRILEPSAGIGNFVTFMPNQIKGKSNITAVELDDLTGNILKYLHDDVNVKVSGIQDAQIPNNSQDLVISNVPFGNYKIYDKAFKGEKAEFLNRIHNYFFAKAIDMARDGGLIAFVTSKGVLDAPGNENLRRYIDQNTEFLGAVRLPDTAFKNNANTEVVTDIIFLKKNSTINKNNPNFINVFKVNAVHKDGEQQDVNVNQYFVDNPQNMLGNIVAGGLYSREDYTVENKTGYDLTEAIKKALPSNVYTKTTSDIGLQANDSQQTIDSIKEGNIEFSGDKLVRKEEGQLNEIKINEPDAKIKHYISLRNALMDLIYSEYIGKPDSELKELRFYLNRQYDTFVSKYGNIIKSATKIAKQDADGYNVLSLYVKGKQNDKADIFRQRTIQPLQNKQSAENIDEAIIISLYENASIDIERIAELMKLSIPEAIQLAKGKLFEEPTGGFVTRDEYLSGNVKKKLKEAQLAVETGNTEFQNNVDELLKVIPKDIPALSIEARLGTRWIPQEVYTNFAKEIFNDPEARIIYRKSLDDYSHNGRTSTIEAKSKYGTERMNGMDILIHALTINPPKIYDTIREFGSEKRVLNVEATANAVEKYEELRTAFEDWVYKDAGRRTLLAGIYNEKYNTSVARQYNGDHLNISGINGVTLRKHQKDAIWMLLQNNGGIIDHLVGAGKTFVMVAGTMEMKRTGIAKKPMIIALKSTIPQIVESYRSAYPMAKVLAPLEKDFSKENRNKLFAQIANNEWDCIIMSHENYGKIPHETEIQQKFIEDEMAEVEDERAELEAAGEKQALKGLEVRLKNLQARLDKISDLDKDNSLTFEQMGIDHLMVDESQQFKNLSYVTKQRGIAGLSKPEGSKRAFNLFIGVRYLQQKYGADKGSTFLSGTPITNSMVEMYLLLKYLRPGKMNELSFNSFDSWATTFASPSSDVEFTVTGDFKQKTRFREFINVPELSMLYREIADIRTDENTPLDKPKMKSGGYTVVDIKMNKDQKRFGRKLIKFAKTKDGKHIGMNLTENQEKAYMLLATNLSSKMAIDLRLINQNYKYDPNGKIGRLVDNVARIFNETAEHKGTQLIFSDLGTPKNKTNKTAMLRDYMEDELGTNLDTLNEIFGDPTQSGYRYPSITRIRERLSAVLELSSDEIDTIIEDAYNSEGSFNVYAEVKYRLIEKGIPEEQIVFIHDYNTQAKKEKLFKEVQQGNIRIVLGSTQKLGTGVNVQDKVVAVHHLDVPWTPAAMEQRNGRALRQGNKLVKEFYNNELPVYAYATELTLDAYKYQLLDTKQRFLTQVKTGDVEDRIVKDVDGDEESGAGYAELVAMMSGNKDFLTKSKLEAKIDKLKRAKRNFLSEVYEAIENIKTIESRIPAIKQRIELTKENVAAIADKMQVDEGGKMIVSDINGQTIETVKDKKGKEVPAERTDYAKKAIDIVHNELNPLRAVELKEYKLFTLNGLHFYGYRTGLSSVTGKIESRIYIKSENGEEYSVNFSEVPGIFLNNIQKAIEGIPSIQKSQENALVKSNNDLASYKELVSKGQEWEKEPELQAATEELKEVTKRLEDSNKEPLKKAKMLLDNYLENGGDFENFVDSIEDLGIEAIDNKAVNNYHDSISVFKNGGITSADMKGIKGEKETLKYFEDNFIKELTEQIEELSKAEQEAAENQQNDKSSDGKIRIGDLAFTLGTDEFVTLATAQNRKGEDVSVVRINEQLDNADYQRYVKPLISLYGGEWNTSNKVVIFKYTEDAQRFKQQVESKFPELANSYDTPITEPEVKPEPELEQEPETKPEPVTKNGVLMGVQEYRHTKTNELLYNVPINGRTDKYHEITDIAKRFNPVNSKKAYSPFAKGFLFKSKEDAQAFKNKVEERFGNNVSEPTGNYRNFDSNEEVQEIQANGSKRNVSGWKFSDANRQYVHTDGTTWNVPTKGIEGNAYKYLQELVTNLRVKQFNPDVFDFWFNKLRRDTQGHYYNADGNRTNARGDNSTLIALSIYDQLPLSDEITNGEINNAYGSEQQHREAIEKTEQFVNKNSGLWTSDRQLQFLFGESTEGRNREPKREPKILEKIRQRTVLEDFKESGYVDFVGRTISSPKDLADLFSIHRSPYIEKFHTIFVKNGKIVGNTAVTTNTGGYTKTEEPAKVKELYDKYEADGVYYLHNHPSGNHKVSVQDVWVTEGHNRILKPQGVNLLGHVIIDTDKFSFINVQDKPFKEVKKFGYYDAENYINNGLVEELNYPNIVPHLFSERESIIVNGVGDQKRLLEISKALLSGRGYKGAIIYITPNLSISAYDVIPEGATMQDAIRIATEGVNKNLGTQVVFIHDGSINDKTLFPKFTLDVIDITDPDKYYSKMPKSRADLVAERLWEPEPDPNNYPIVTDYLKAVKEHKRNLPVTETAAFKKWFGDSKVVDENGKPLVVYHGSNGNATDINENSFRYNGFYTTAFPEYANKFAESGSVIPVYAKIENPFIINMENNNFGVRGGFVIDERLFPSYRELSKDDIQFLKDKGYDGIIVNVPSELTRTKYSEGIQNKFEVVTFSPTQIKSATGNNGNFDPSNPSIVEEVIGEYETPYNRPVRDNYNSLPQYLDALDNHYKNLPQIEQPAFKRWFNKSKAVDENGNPLPLYHASFEKFNEFSKEKLGSNTGARSAKEGFFFASNKKVAESYASTPVEKLKQLEKKADAARKELMELTGDTQISASMALVRRSYGHKTDYTQEQEKRVEELLEIMIDYDDFAETMNDDYWAPDDELSDNAQLYSVYLSMQNPLIKDLNFNDYRKESYYKIIKEAKAAGYDGVILKNTYDGGTAKGNVEETDIYVVFEPTQIKSATGNNGNFDPNNPSIVEEVIGEYGARNLDKAEEANFRMNNLTVAREMETMGKTPKAIKLATSWERGADGKWRYEIPDGELRMNYMDAVILEKAVKWDELFTAYPELRYVQIGALSPDESEMAGSYTPKAGIGGKGMIFAGGDGMEQVKSVLLHEIQHAIQEIEGFANGGNVMTAKSTMTLEEQVELQNLLNDLHDLQKLRDDAQFGAETRRNAQLAILDIKAKIKKIHPLRRYQRLAGEVEARNVQARMNMDDWERHNSLLEETEDVSRKDQIFIFDSFGEKMLSILPLDNLLDNARQRYAEKKRQKRELKEVIDGVRQYYQDNALPIRKMEEEVKELGGSQKDSQKPYRDLSLSYGRLEELYKDFVNDRMKPVLKTISEISKTGIGRDYVLPYVICKHAVERNPYMREKELNEWIKANEEAAPEELAAKEEELTKKDYSGVTGFNYDKNGNIVNPDFENNPDGLAQAIVDEFEERVPEELTNKLLGNIRSATNEIITYWQKGLTISDEQANEMLNRYKNYVPLRGWKDGAAKELVYTKGEGFSRSMQSAMGRTSFADNPLAYLNQVAFQAIGEQVDNEVKKSLLSLVTANYSQEFKHIYELKKAYYIKATLDDGSEGWQLSIDPETGEIVRPPEEMFQNGEATTKVYNRHEKLRKPSHAREHEVTVRTPAGDMIIVFKNKYLQVAQAMNNQNRMYISLISGKVLDANDWNNKIINTIGGVNNFIKRNLTSRNVVFALTNFSRDLPEASITAFIKGESGLSVVKNSIGHAFASYARELSGKSNPTSNKYDKYMKEFREAGGTTGYTHLKDIEQIKDEMDRMLRQMSRKGISKIGNVWSMAGRSLDTWSDMFETATRLGVFISSREAGKTIKDAAIDAKEYSVNFNRKGKISKALDAIYAFFNVSVQSLQKNTSLAKRYPKRFSIVAASFMLLGLLEAMLNDLSSDDDSDEDYYNINDYVRQNYLIIPGPGEKYIRIPLPQFWRGFKSMGSVVYDTFRSDINKVLFDKNVEDRLTAKDAGIKAFANFFASLTPVDLGGLFVDGELNLSPIAPTVAKPFAEIAENKNYMGYQIAKEPFTKEQEKLLAKSGLYKNDVNPAIRFFTDYLAKTGGIENKTKFYREDGHSEKVDWIFDWNPSQIDHVVKGYLGGTYKVASDAIATAAQAIRQDEEVDFNNVPFVNSFIRNTPEVKWRTIQQYYDLRDDNGYFSFSALKREYKAAGKMDEFRNISSDRYLNKYSTILNTYDKKIEALMNSMDYKSAEDSDVITDTMKEAIKKIDDLKKEYKIK